jgi:hypothetical protein
MKRIYRDLFPVFRIFMLLSAFGFFAYFFLMSFKTFIYPVIFKYYNSGKEVETVTMIVLLTTLIAIIWYSLETRMLRITQHKSFISDRVLGLINTYLQIIPLIVKIDNKEYKGEEVILLFYDEFKNEYEKQKEINLTNKIIKKDFDVCTDAFCKVYFNNIQNYQNLLSFLNIYDNILKNIVDMKNKYPDDYAYLKLKFQCILTKTHSKLFFYYVISTYVINEAEYINETEKITKQVISDKDLINISHINLYD